MKRFSIFPLTILTFAGTLLAADQPDNILIITADNIGYGDLPSYNPATTIKTPNLDRFASQGARLTNFYTASPTCTVSRACLLTGRISLRHGLKNQLSGVKGNYGIGLNHREVLISSILKKAPIPYATACFGKWNVGFAEGSKPTERGFDEFVGHVSGNMDFYHHHYHKKHDLYRGTEELFLEGKYATDIFADAAIDFIGRQQKDQADKPWFVYLPFNAPHYPNHSNKRTGQATRYQAPDWAFKEIGLSPDETDAKNRYDAVVYALDKAIGRVLDSLDKTGAADNTFVFFMSDNGAFRLNRKGLDVGINDPLRDGGVTCWEGGLRVPAMVRWPGKIKKGSVIDEPFWSPDLLVTAAEVAGATLPPELVYDGKNVLPLLTEAVKTPHQSFLFTYLKQTSLRKGDWKIVREQPDQPWQLFNLDADISESTNLADKEQRRLGELTIEYAKWLKSLE